MVFTGNYRPVIIIEALVSILALAALSKYKELSHQVFICKFSVILSVILLAFFYLVFKYLAFPLVSDHTLNIHLSWGGYLLLFNPVFFFLAAIQNSKTVAVDP